MARHGENIRKRKDGRWEGRYIKGRTPDGKAKLGYVYGKTYGQVRQTLIQCRAQCGERILSAENPTFGQLAQDWLNSLGSSVKGSTAAHYEYTLRRYLLPQLQGLRLRSLDERVLEAALLRMFSGENGLHRPLGTSLARECLILVRRICKYGSHLRLMRPMDIQVNLPRSSRPPVQPLSTAQAQAVDRYVRQAPTARKVGLLLCLQLGLRIGEVCGLQWGDFDPENKTLTIQRTVQRIVLPGGGTRLAIQTPKTQNSLRLLPLPARLCSLLQTVRKALPDTAWVLTGSTRKPAEPRNFRRSIRVYLLRAQVPPVHPHALRHTFATLCLQAGCDIKTLSELLGHSNAAVTLQRYVHTSLNQKRLEMRRIFSACFAPKGSVKGASRPQTLHFSCVFRD